MAGSIESAVWSSIQRIPDKRQQIAEASRQFEALLIEHLLRTMREAGQDEHAQEAGGAMYLEMGEQAMAQALTQRGGLGISQVIAKSLAGHEQARPDTPQKTGLTIPPSRTISVHESAGLSPPRPNYNEDQ